MTNLPVHTMPATWMTMRLKIVRRKRDLERAMAENGWMSSLETNEDFLIKKS